MTDLQWYTAEDGKQAGPWTTESVRERLRNGRLPADTLVWREGFAEWTSAASVPEFAPDEPAAPIAPVQSGNAHPWHRWFARMIDVSVAGAILGFILGFIGQEALFDNTVVAGFWVLLFLAFIAEPVWMTVFGMTPGKWLLNISVTKADSTRFDFLSALQRSVRVWIIGLAMGIPLLSLLTIYRQYDALRKKGVATYDEGKYRVVHEEIPGRRKIWLTVIVLLILALAWLGTVASLPKQ